MFIPVRERCPRGLTLCGDGRHDSATRCTLIPTRHFCGRLVSITPTFHNGGGLTQNYTTFSMNELYKWAKFNILNLPYILLFEGMGQMTLWKSFQK